MDYDRVTERVAAGLLQGFVVAFVGLAAFLPASYVMNRYIYRTWTMRTFMGVLAALMGMGGLIIMLILRLYHGNEMLVHYFGFLPILTEGNETPNKTKDYVESIKKLFSIITVPITFYYNTTEDTLGYKQAVDSFVDTFRSDETGEALNINGIPTSLKVYPNCVSEELFTFARSFGYVWGDNMKQDEWEKIKDNLPVIGKKYNYADLSINSASAIGKVLFK